MTLLLSTEAQTGSLLPARPELGEARLRVFEAAIALFGAKSYDSVSVRDLANALGMAPGGIYAHVPSKQHLLFELVRIGHEEHRDRLKEALLGAGPSPQDQLGALTRAHVTVHLEYSALARVTNREARALGEDQLAVVLQVRAESEQMFLDVIDRGVRLGAFDDAQPRLAVLAIAAMGVRAAEWWTPDYPTSVTEIADTYAEYALRLLRKG
ncbi:MAG: TetR family transcriptional regulator, partial [Frankiales bacterium]|nr:TetR family transcriptional regulator [Frankiales bacterium]